ncbi:hypothetical protein ACX9VS_04740 [Weissella paramesenteroides]|uniref:HAD family hydrolase n=1 Tax=Weissella sagaensis TaxID=2559928 RepID=A0ABW1RQY1_9LACO|nr:hypothetical protein [Weissella sagaensis]
MEKYLTFDCYGTLLNEEATYAAIETVADKIGVDPRLVRDLSVPKKPVHNLDISADIDLNAYQTLIEVQAAIG